MKFELIKSHVEITPETPEEVAGLDELWKMMSDCVGKEKKLVPMGIYVAEKNKPAMFHIEGLSSAEIGQDIEVLAPVDCDVYCKTCNKTVSVKQGARIPLCCGKRMEILD